MSSLVSASPDDPTNLCKLSFILVINEDIVALRYGLFKERAVVNQQVESNDEETAVPAVA
jgi:hypothetical protein